MKKTLTILPLMLGILFFFTQCEKEPIDLGNINNEDVIALKDATDNCFVVQTLWAGAGQNNTNNGTNVGEVTATVVGNTLVVEYSVEAPWYLTETHLWVGKNIKDIPKQAAPGRFPFSASLNYASGWTQVVNLAERGISPGDKIYVAAHGVVVNTFTGEVNYDALALPQAINFEWTFFNNLVNPRSYFEITITDTWLADVYEGWCADSRYPAGANPRTGTVYSSYDATISSQFEKPENLPLINWIINYDFVGKASISGGNFTLGDLQRAIWTLLWNNPNLNPPGGVGLSDEDRVAEIIAMAIANGDGYMPGCGDYIVLVIVQEDSWQNMFFKYPVPCFGGDDETIWAFGDYTFIGEKIAKKWGWIFDIDCY